MVGLYLPASRSSTFKFNIIDLKYLQVRKVYYFQYRHPPRRKATGTEHDPQKQLHPSYATYKVTKFSSTRYQTLLHNTGARST